MEGVEAAVSERRMDEAAKLLETLLAMSPKRASVWGRIAKIRFDLGEYSAAIDALGRHKELKSLGIRESILLARASQRIGDLARAQAVLEEVLGFNPGQESALLHLSSVYTELGDHEKALDVLRQLEERGLQDPKVLFLIARAYRNLGDCSRALEALDRFESLGSLNSKERLLHARTALNVGKPERAKDILERLLAADPNNQVALFHLSEVQTRLGDRAGSAISLRQCAELEPTDANGWLLRGRALRALGDFQLALVALERAGEEGGDPLTVRTEIAEIELRQGYLTRGAAALDELIKENPDSIKPLFLRGRLLAKQGECDRGAMLLHRVLDMDPAHSGALHEMATIRTYEGDTEGAIGFLAQAVKMRPGDARLHTELAGLYLQVGRLSAAREHALRAEKLDPVIDEPKHILATLALMSGGGAENVSLSIVPMSENVAEKMGELPPRTDVLPASMAAADLRDLLAQSGSDWVAWLTEDFRTEQIPVLRERLVEHGSLIRFGSRPLAIRTRLIEAAAKAWKDEALDAATFRQRILASAREIYPAFPHGHEGPERMAEPRMWGEVLLVSSSGHRLFGGGEHFLRTMATVYRELGFTPRILGLRGESVQEGVTADGTPFNEFPPNSTPALRDFLLQRRPALAHLLSGSGQAMLRAAEDIELPTIYGTHFWREMFHGQGWFANIDVNPVPRQDFTRLATQMSVFYVNSTFTRNMQYEHHKVVSPVLYSLPETETEVADRAGRDIVLLVNARPEKGFDLLLEVAERLPDIDFVAIANQSAKGDAKEAVAARGLANVEISDQVEDMSQLYRRAWCVVVPSYRFVETFSRVVIEAHRFGVPVIGSDRGNVPRLLAESGVALPEDAEAWTSELRHLHDDPAYWRERSRRASENSERYAFALQRPIVEGFVKAATRPILVAVGAGIGNIIQCTPAIRRLSDYLGQPVDVVINQDFPGCEWLLAGSPHVNLVFASDTPLIRRRYEYVIVLPSFGKSIPAFHGRHVFIARNRFPFRLTENVHEARYNLDCVVGAGLGVTYEDSDVPRYFVADARPTGLKSRRIVLHAGGKGDEWLAKRWPYFEELAAALVSDGWEVISIGSRAEYVPGTVDRTGTPLRETIATIADAAYLVANDSGCMHIADGIGVPLTAIFAPTSVVKNGPLSSGSQVVQLEKSCAPCQFNERFKTCRCIGELTPELVIGSVRAHLQTVGAGGASKRSRTLQATWGMSEEPVAIHNFLISAMGRSGTKFLSSLMNKSSQWTVLHEPRISRNRVTASEVQARFNRDYYGEVNSYLRWCFADVEVARRGIIIRNPKENLASACNRRPPTLDIQRGIVDRIIDDLNILVDHIARDDVRLIRFEKMTTDLDYLKQVFIDFGVVDWAPTAADMKMRVNQNPKPSIFEDLPEEIRESFLRRAEFYMKEYYPDELVPSSSKTVR